MRYVAGAVVLLFIVAVAYGALTRRIQARSCCAADPTRDLRMRGAALPHASVHGLGTSSSDPAPPGAQQRRA